MGGASADASPPGIDAGLRSMLAPWMGGAAAPQQTPPVDGGCRSLLAFWMGGACAASSTPPVPPPQVIGGYRYTLPAPVIDGLRRHLIDEDDMLVSLSAYLIASRQLH